MAPENERTALYRLYDAGDKFLYAGISTDPERRFREHAASKDWWGVVARRDVEWFGSRLAAAAAEEAAIKAHSPAFNREHSPDWPYITVTVTLSENQVRSLDLLCKVVGLVPMAPPETVTGCRDATLYCLLMRELSARGLTGDPRCLHHNGVPWPDGVTLDGAEGPCSCGYILGTDGDYFRRSDGEQAA